MAVEACTASRRKCCSCGAQSKAEHPESREATLGGCLHPLNAGTEGAALAAQIFISRNRSSSSAPATANNTRLAFTATEATMETREGMELAFWRRALGFFCTIYLFIGPTLSAFKAAKQFLTYLYLISADDRQLCTEDKPHSLSCVQLAGCTGGPWWRGRERAEGMVPRSFNIWNCKDKSSKVICPRWCSKCQELNPDPLSHSPVP